MNLTQTPEIEGSRSFMSSSAGESVPIAFLDGVTKSFGQVVALSDLTLSIEEGKIVGFLGPNGAGKTTTIKLLLGLIRPNRGIVRLFGRDPFDDYLVKKHVSHIPENDCFYPWITAKDFLIHLASYTMPHEAAKRRAYEVLAEVGLTHVAEKRIKQFSKGMRQRMKIAQAIINEPRLIIGDEPFNGLDPLVRKQMYDLFLKYKEERGITFFISSHILFEVERLAEKIILIYKGRTIAHGDPIKIREMMLDRPHSILIRTPKPKELAKELIDYDHIIKSVTFQFNQNTGEPELIVLTHTPGNFYEGITEIAAKKGITITTLKPTDDGLEALFKILTQG